MLAFLLPALRITRECRRDSPELGQLENSVVQALRGPPPKQERGSEVLELVGRVLQGHLKVRMSGISVGRM